MSNSTVLRSFQESVLYCREDGNHTVAVKKLYGEVSYCKMQVFQCIPFRLAMNLKSFYAAHRLLTALKSITRISNSFTMPRVFSPAVSFFTHLHATTEFIH